jgi:multidrug resistance efflux pump
VQQTVTAPGKLAELDLPPGDRVQAGQTRARLGTAPLERALEEAQLKLSLAEAAYARQLSNAERMGRNSHAPSSSAPQGELSLCLCSKWARRFLRTSGARKPSVSRAFGSPSGMAG